MVDECKLAFVVRKTDAIEAPSVPRVSLDIGFLVCDKRLRRLLDPKHVGARRAQNHLLGRGDEIVVQHLAVRIQDGLVNQFGLQVAAFKPGLALGAVELI